MPVAQRLDSLQNHNLTNLYSFLGYKKGDPTRDSNRFQHEVDSYFIDYEARSQKIPPCSKVNIPEARLCATSFLAEDDRGEYFFPRNSDNNLTWPDDEERIVEAVAYIFRFRAFNTYATLKQKERATNASESGIPQKSAKKRSQDSNTDEDGFGIRDLDEKYYLRPWRDPPERFNRAAAIEHVKELNPGRGQEVTGLTREWMLKGDYTFPGTGISIIQRFMHNRNFYFMGDPRRGTFRELVDKLRSGTELEGISGTQYAKLERRVGDEIRYWSNKFKSFHFLEDSPLTSTLEKTPRFKHLWDGKEEHWKAALRRMPTSIQHSQPKRQRRTPTKNLPNISVYFPNLPNHTQANNNIPDLGDLASVAGTALEVSDHTQQTEGGRPPASRQDFVISEDFHDIKTVASSPHHGISPDSRQSQDVDASICETIEVEVPDQGSALSPGLATEPFRTYQTPGSPSPSLNRRVGSPHQAPWIHTSELHKSPQSHITAHLSNPPTRKVESIEPETHPELENFMSAFSLPQYRTRLMAPASMSTSKLKKWQGSDPNLPLFNREYRPTSSSAIPVASTQQATESYSSFDPGDFKNAQTSCTGCFDIPSSSESISPRTWPLSVSELPLPVESIASLQPTSSSPSLSGPQPKGGQPGELAQEKDSEAHGHSDQIQHGPPQSHLSDNPIGIGKSGDMPTQTGNVPKAETAKEAPIVDLSIETGNSPSNKDQASSNSESTPKRMDKVSDNIIKASQEPELHRRSISRTQTPEAGTNSPVETQVAHPQTISPLQDNPSYSSQQQDPEIVLQITQPQKPITPSRTPSPVPILELQPRPYHYIPPQHHFSVQKPIPSELTPMALSPVQLSPEPKPMTAHRSPPTKDKSGKILKVIFETQDKDLDFDNPVDFAEISNWSLEQFFEFYAQKSEHHVASLTKLNVSITFGNHQNFLVERYGGDQKWQETKERLESLFDRERKKKKDRATFDVLVEV